MKKGKSKATEQQLKNLAQPRKRKGMSIFDNKSESLSSNYVFYQILNNSENDKPPGTPEGKKLYENLLKVFGNEGFLDQQLGTEKLGHYLLTMAKNEQAKELRWLQELGLNGLTSEDLIDEDGDKELIKAFNIFGGYSDRFERLIWRTKNSKHVSSISGDIHDYIERAFESNWPTLEEEIQNAARKIEWAKYDSSEDVLSDWVKIDVEPLLQSYAKISVKQGLIKAFSSQKNEHATNKEREDAKREYEDLIKELETDYNHQGSFFKQVWNILKIDRIIDDMKDVIKNYGEEYVSNFDNSTKLDSFLDKTYTSKKIKNSYWLKGGFIHERLAALALNKSMDEVKKNLNFKNKMGTIQIYVTGEQEYTTGGGNGKERVTETFQGDTEKADLMLGVNIPHLSLNNSEDMTALNNVMQFRRDGVHLDTKGRIVSKKNGDTLQNSITDRITNAAYAHMTQDSLKRMKRGAVAYVNAKLKYNFEKGASAGTDITAQTYIDMHSISRMKGKAQTLIGAVINTMTGAIYESKKTNVENMLSADIATFLFDDFETIGDEIATYNGGEGYGGAATVHLLLINEMYIPLSIFLKQLGNAFLNCDKKTVQKYAKPKITAGSILYEESNWSDGNFLKGYMQNKKEYWENQKKTALSEVTISQTFFKNFSKFIADIFPEI